MNVTDKPADTVHVLLLTATDYERDVTLETFRVDRTKQLVPSDANADEIEPVYHRWQMPIFGGVGKYTIVLSRAEGMGWPAYELTRTAVLRWKPKVVIFVGVAGKAAESHASVNHVAVARSLHWVSSELAPDAEAMDANLLSRIELMLGESPIPGVSGKANFLQGFEPLGDTDGNRIDARVWTGPFVHSPTKVKDPVRKAELSALVPKCEAIEMEGMPFGMAVRYLRTKRSLTVRPLMIKAFSDAADGEQDRLSEGEKQSKKRFSTRMAAAVTKFLLEHDLLDLFPKISVPPPPPPPPPPPHESDWQIITPSWVAGFRATPPDTDALVEFFDGNEVQWGLALCDAVPRRKIVDEMVERLMKVAKPGTTSVTLLSGAGGEGKSTILRQIVGRLVDTDPGRWHILFRTGRKLEPLPAAEPGTVRLIVSDDADEIAEWVYRRAVESRNRPPNADVSTHYLLASRRIDWDAALRSYSKLHNGRSMDWATVLTPTSYEVTVGGLNRVDAERLYSSWQKLGDAGLQDLKGTPRDQAVTQLVSAGKNTAEGDGAFLGALLRVRLGPEGLRRKVASVLKRFSEISVQGYPVCQSLRDPYVLIAGPSAVGLDGMDVRILGAAVQSDNRLKLVDELIRPLGIEVVLRQNEDVVSARHTEIAKAVVRYLIEDNQITRLQAMYNRIVSSFVRLRTQRRNPFSDDESRDCFLLAMEGWDDLPARFTDDRSSWLDVDRTRFHRKSFAVQLARLAVGEQLKHDKGQQLDRRYLNRLCEVMYQYSVDSHPHTPTETQTNIRNHLDWIRGIGLEHPEGFDRAVYRTWSKCEQAMGRPFTAIWLAAGSFSDHQQTNKHELVNDDVSMGLKLIVDALDVIRGSLTHDDPDRVGFVDLIGTVRVLLEQWGKGTAGETLRRQFLDQYQTLSPIVDRRVRTEGLPKTRMPMPSALTFHGVLSL